MVKTKRRPGERRATKRQFGEFGPLEQQVRDLLNEVCTAIDEGGSRFPGMTYEQGIEAALRWVLDSDDADDPYPA